MAACADGTASSTPASKAEAVSTVRIMDRSLHEVGA
jgi:hypothetical protein